MSLLLTHGREAFILFTFPLAGLAMTGLLTPRQALWTAGVAALLLLPAIADFRYTIPFAFRILAIVMGGALFCFFTKGMESSKQRNRLAITWSILLFIPLAFLAFISGIAGHTRVAKTWISNGYRVEHIVEQGFAGGPLNTYELGKYTTIPIMIRVIETRRRETTDSGCKFIFPETGIELDKCSGAILKR